MKTLKHMALCVLYFYCIFRVGDETVKSDIKQMVRQWEQILNDYKAWHANLDVCFYIC